MLSKLALIPQSLLSAYTEKDASTAAKNGVWKTGDFVVSFAECGGPNRNCHEEMRPWFQRLHGLVI